MQRVKKGFPEGLLASPMSTSLPSLTGEVVMVRLIPTHECGKFFLAYLNQVRFGGIDIHRNFWELRMRLPIHSNTINPRKICIVV